MKDFNCIGCGNKFTRTTKEINRGRVKYCGRDCFLKTYHPSQTIIDKIKKNHCKNKLIKEKRKKCIICQKSKLNTLKFFPLSTRHHFRLDSRCYKCKRDYVNKWANNKRNNNPKLKIKDSVKSMIRQALKEKKAGKKWESIVGYKLEDLVKHLENNFDENMSWNNYGKYWVIDHIKPRSLFKDIEIKECWKLNNIQPLEKRANLLKRDKYNDNDIAPLKEKIYE